MDKEQAARFGTWLREQRKAAGMSTHELGERIGKVKNSTIIRIEQGAFKAPSADKLARIADVLGISLADMYGHAGYAVPNDLPAFSAYLPARYRDLPESAIHELVELFETLLERHGLTPQAETVGADDGDAVEATS